MRKILAMLLLAAGSVCATDDSINSLSKTLEQIKSIKANFVQTVYNKDNRVLQRSGGIVEFKKPNCFRWQIVEPDPALLISDGKTFWNYDEQLAQVTIERAAALDPISPLSFLTGDPARYFKIEQISNTSYRLTPKSAHANYNYLEIFFMRGKLSQMHLHDKLDQVSVFEFMQVQNNLDLDNTRFNFTPPAGVDVIEEK